MSKKFFVSLAITLFTVFSFSICLANDGKTTFGTATNDVRNFVGGVEDKVENGARDISNTSKNMTSKTENTMTRNNSNTGYTATRTNATVMGMSQNAWTWLIMGIAAIAIIAVVWYYSMQFTNTGRKGNNNNDDDE